MSNNKGRPGGSPLLVWWAVPFLHFYGAQGAPYMLLKGLGEGAGGFRYLRSLSFYRKPKTENRKLSFPLAPSPKDFLLPRLSSPHGDGEALGAEVEFYPLLGGGKVHGDAPLILHGQSGHAAGHGDARAHGRIGAGEVREPL